MRQALPILLVLALIVPVAADTGGGTVSNVDPVEDSFSGDQGSQDNLNAVTETFSFQVHDNNGEADLAGVKISSDDATFGTQECLDVTVGTSCTDWTFTDSTPNDGILTGTFTYEWPAGQTAGTFTQTFSVKDEGSYVTGSTDQTIFTSAAQVTVEAGTYTGAGASDGGNWGGWTANPGATNVASTNFLKATNSGTAAGQVTVSFSATDFTGPSSIAIDGNLKFCTGTGATPDAGMTCDPVDADGSDQFSVPASGTLWIGYEIAAMPSVLPDGSYTATYTFTDTS